MWKNYLSYGQPTFMNHQGSGIIDLFMSAVELTKPCTMLWDELSLNLEHKLIFLTYQARDISLLLTPKPRLAWFLGKLKIPRLHVRILRYSGQHLRIFPCILLLIFKDFQDASTCIE